MDDWIHPYLRLQVRVCRSGEKHRLSINSQTMIITDTRKPAYVSTTPFSLVHIRTYQQTVDLGNQCQFDECFVHTHWSHARQWGAFALSVPGTPSHSRPGADCSSQALLDGVDDGPMIRLPTSLTLTHTLYLSEMLTD